MTQSTCKEKLPLILPSLCIVLAAVFIILSTVTLPAVLKSSIEQELKMAPDTYEYWGQSPGKTKSVTKRNFTFFNFTNPRQFLYQNATPVFNAVHGFLLQQRFNYTEYKYSDSMDEVFYNDWLHFTQLPGTKNIDTKLNVLNLGPLGFWYQLDLVGMPTFALQGFGGLYLELSQTFKTQAIGQGVNSQFLGNYSNWRSVCDDLQISQQQCNNTWQDPQHGLCDQNNYQIWIEFGLYNDNQAENYLKTYFGFDDMQMQQLQTVFYGWADTLNEILDNWFCDGSPCSSQYLTLLQLSSGSVTANPPSGDPVDSICDTGNVTCIGQPEISKFLKNQFRNKYDDQKYQKLKFSTSTFSRLFTPYTGTLLNIGNLTTLFETGYKLDATESVKERNSILSQIRLQTHVETNDHALVVWEWVKYFASEFVVKFSKGGSEKNSGIGGVFSQAFYGAFSEFGDWIVEEYLNVLGQQQIQDCQTFIRQNINSIPFQKANIICEPINQKKSGLSILFRPCFYSVEEKQKFRVLNGLRLTELADFCDTEQTSFYTVAQKIHRKMFEQYSCNNKKGVKICSGYELAMKQFINSSVTLNPIANSIKTYSPSVTAKAWNPSLDQFEYKNFLKQVYNNQSFDSQVLTQKQLIDLLSFDKLFSASMVMELMIENDAIEFEQLYYWKNMTLLKNFIKFITIEVGFGGFTQTRSPRQLLFGYEDPFLENLKETDTMMGGDPSINPVIMLNEPNITQNQASLFPQSVYTGYSDIQLTRQYKTLYGYDYITYNKTWYDGYNVRSQFISPYKTHIKVTGTDSIQNPPNLDEKSSIYCLITNIYRTARLDYAEPAQMYGMDLLKFTVSKSFLAAESQMPYNGNYYQKFEGFHNVTFLGVPLHISKNNFYSCPSNWSQLIKVYDENNSYPIKSSVNDDTVLKVEPNTGALFFATVRLQTNYHFQSDVLFGPSDRMLPVTNVIRQGEIDQEIVDELFGDLKTALKLSKALMIMATIMIPLSLLFITYRCYTHSIKAKNERQEIEESLIEKDSLVTEGTLIVQTKTQMVREENQANSASIDRIQASSEANNQTISENPTQRIPEINTIVMPQQQLAKPQQQSVSIFPNINGTILDQE